VILKAIEAPWSIQSQHREWPQNMQRSHPDTWASDPPHSGHDLLVSSDETLSPNSESKCSPLERHMLLIDFTVRTGGGRKCRQIALHQLCHAGTASMPHNAHFEPEGPVGSSSSLPPVGAFVARFRAWAPKLTLQGDFAFSTSEMPAFPLLAAAQAAD